MGERTRRFRAGEAGKSLMSLMAGEIGFGESFEDVRHQLEMLDETQKKSLILLVACDRIYGFFENRGGTTNGSRLVKLVRDLAGDLHLSFRPPSRNLDEIDVSKKEARSYYDELVKMGAIEFVSELGAKNVFCTIWEYINKIVGEKEATLEETLRP
ncbi:hypothetical protein HYU90_02805 [Candidatus Collierbacteria bacterium]|nr:hypothetical protein [Candidatus Collierbacteria bacterium]